MVRHVNPAKAAEVQALLCRNDSPIWRQLRVSQASLEDLAASLARAGDASRAVLDTVKQDRGGEALVLLREIYESCRDRLPHRGRVLRKAQWDKVVKLIQAQS